MVCNEIKRFFQFKFCHYFFRKKVQDLGRDVWHNVANIFKVAVAVFFDDFEVDKSWYQNILHVNYDPNTKRATKALTLADGHIVCDDCWAKLDLEIKVIENCDLILF